MTVPITGSVKDVTGVEDNDTPWSFASVIRFAEDGSVITEKPREVRAVSGNLKVNLVPGYAIVTYGKQVWQVTVPETATTLKALIEAGVAFPPDTAQALLDAAVGQYVEANREQFRTRAVPVVGSPGMVQWKDETGANVGVPVPQGEVISEEVAIMAAEAAAPAAVSDYVETLEPQVIPGVTPDTVQFQIGTAVGPEFPAAVGLLDGIAVAGNDGQIVTVDDAGLVVHDPLYINPSQAPYNVKFDGLSVAGASMSSSSNPTHLTVSGYTFTSADVGKVVKVVGAGSAGTNLKTTITGVSSGKAVLAAPCQTTVGSTSALFGTDNQDALNLLFDDLSYAAGGDKLSRVAVMPKGVAFFSGTLEGHVRGTLKGCAENWIEYFTIYGRITNSAHCQGTVLYQIWDQNVDGLRFRDVFSGQHDWNGKISGFSVQQDKENTAGSGVVFRNLAGDRLQVIDGGVVDRVAAMGWAQKGIDFAGGSITAVYRDLVAFACGYRDRKAFTADTTSGSHVLSNVSDFTGIFNGGIIHGPGIPVDSSVSSFNSGAGTINLSQPAAATATGVSCQQAGSPGINYVIRSSEVVKFDAPSGDQCSGGMLQIEYVAGFTDSTQTASISVGTLKNEFGTNVYDASFDPTVTPSIPQGANAVVLRDLPGTIVNIDGLVHWADSNSSVGGALPNTLGRHIGAAVISIPSANLDTPPKVSWKGVSIRLAAGSGQTAKYAYRNNRSVTFLPIGLDASGEGANYVKQRPIRTVGDANTTLTVHDHTVAWTALTAARTATLPLLSAVPEGAGFLLIDASGSGSLTAGRTVTATPTGSDTISGDTAVSAPCEQLWVTKINGVWHGVGTSDVVTRATAQTISEKRITPRMGADTSTATPTPNADQHDQYNLNALAEAATFAAPSGTPVHGQEIMIRVKDNGVSQTLAFNAIYRFFVTAPTATVAGKVMYLRIRFHANDVKWDVLSVAQQP